MSAHQNLIAHEDIRQTPLSHGSPQGLRKQSLHVLTLTPFYPLEGDEGFGCFIAEPLAAVEKAGLRNSVIFASPFYRSRKPVRDSGLPATAVRYLSVPKGMGLPSAGAFLFARVVSFVRKLTEVHPVSLIHAHGALPCGHAALLLSRELGIPYVVTVHGLDAYSTRQVKGFAGRWCERVSQITYQGARRVICISERVRQEVGAFSTEVVHNGVDTELFYPVQEAVDAEPVILSVGNLIPSKGHRLLLQAIAAARRQFPSVHAEIAGDGPERECLLRLARELQIGDHVTFLGRLTRKEVADALRRCTVFALPSSYEALGCVYLEAMATGKPVVACSGQGISDIVHSGQNGLLVEPDKLAELTSALTTLFSDANVRRRMGAAAHRTVHRNLTLAHQAENLTRIFSECVR